MINQHRANGARPHRVASVPGVNRASSFSSQSPVAVARGASSVLRDKPTKDDKEDAREEDAKPGTEEEKLGAVGSCFLLGDC